MTVDPQSAGYDPSPLIGYCKALGVTYHYEEQGLFYISQSDETGKSRHDIVFLARICLTMHLTSQHKLPITLMFREKKFYRYDN